ncbi:MAG: DUF6319 family protein, partial [Pseudonocardiales bacterium]|nr:DUF6319 family protein [Pseudonocardiales bacterium]
DAGAPEPAAPARAGTARGSKRRAAPAEVRVGLVATPEGEWSVEVHVGARRVVAPTPVPAADVAVAARALPAAVGEVVSATLEQARRRQHERVEQLRAELEAAQRALEQLAP